MDKLSEYRSNIIPELKLSEYRTLSVPVTFWLLQRKFKHAKQKQKEYYSISDCKHARNTQLEFTKVANAGDSSNYMPLQLYYDMIGKGFKITDYKSYGGISNIKKYKK